VTIATINEEDQKAEAQRVQAPTGESTPSNSASSEPMAPGPLFVVGMWRSGTSLLYALLNQHPQVGLMYESDFPPLSPVFLVPRKDWPAKVDSWTGALTRHKIDISALPEKVSGLPEAFRAVAHQYAQKKDATVWGCKSPTYYDSMNQLADWFPDAKFIVIWRDPADVCRSIVRAAEKSPWFAKPGMDLRALLGYRRMKQEADNLVHRGAAIHQLQYDDLVREPASELSAICDFIGVQYDPRMNSLEGADRSAIYSGDHHSMVKSAAIVSKRDRPEVLSPGLRKKIERYVVYWRKESGGKWPLNAAVTQGTRAADWLERTRDRLRHTFFRILDAIIPLLFCFVPIPIWQKYRQVKSRYRQNAVKSHSDKATQ